MKKRILGKDLEVSAVGLGCMGMSHAYGPAADKKEMTELLAQAVEMGYTFFDTAEVYGTPENPHDNEELLGTALRPYRDQIVLASKCGIRFDETSSAVNKPLIPDGRPETIKKSAEGSLKRLNTDHLDLYYIHRIDKNVPIEEPSGAMNELIEAGKITHWGISEADEETLRRACKVCPVTAVQNRYSMMYRDYEALFPPESIDKNQEMLRQLEEMADKKDATPAQISLAWMLAKKPWIVPIPGTRKYGRLLENARASEVELTDQEVRELDKMLDTVPMSEVFGGSRVEDKK